MRAIPIGLLTAIMLPIAPLRTAAQQSGGRVEFEVAAINPANIVKITAGATSSSRVGGGRFEVRGFTLKALVKMAYRIQDYQISGGPKWFDSETYDIDAKFPAGATDQQVPQMLQSLLADRFHLAFHHETRTVSAYELVAAKNGPTLHEAPADKGQGLGSGPRMIRSKGASMAALVDKLGEMLECPVVDRTGLQGIYAFDLAFAPIQPDPSGNDSGPSIFSALQEQMGLKLEKTKAPVEVTVIDRAEKPSAN
jgi:uncharacterized protein (TIGR03435 family)